jgi:hypothetical protein
MKMRIEILYVPGCPNYQPALEGVKKVLASESVASEVHSLRVTTDAEAKALLFPGSPTVRVNGRDIEPSAVIVPGLACRIYPNGTGIPPEEIVRAAISEAKRME